MPANTIIVGAGLAGLSCAARLHESGHEITVLEASDGVGGRVRTDKVDGFLLDRGFQVFLDAYPTAARFLDLDALDLRPFRSGAVVFHRGKLRRIMDGLRHPEHALGTALQPVGSIADKLRILRLRHRALHGPELERDQSTESFLRDFGFSREMIDVFFRSFYGGIFLERELRTSARMFLFTFAMFSKGHATLPAKGMGAIPAQLAQRLRDDAIRLRSKVVQFDAGGATLESGETLSANHLVMAVGGIDQVKSWRAVTSLYFSAAQPPLREAIIALAGAGDRLVNNVCVLSEVAPGYAPPDKALISVSVLGSPPIDHLAEEVQSELVGWFGDAVRTWELLRIDRIPRALPQQLPNEDTGPGFTLNDGVYICGDHCTSASIEGAITSGLAAAEAILGE